MLFLSLVSAEYIKLLTSDMFIGLDRDNNLVPVDMDNAMFVSRESVNDGSPFTMFKDANGQYFSVGKDGSVKLSTKEIANFLVSLSFRGGFLISKDSQCLGYYEYSKKIELGGCTDGDFNNLFIIVNSRDGSRADVRMKSKNHAINTKPVISFGKYFSWTKIKNTDIQAMLNPFSSKSSENGARKSGKRELVKFNEF